MTLDDFARYVARAVLREDFEEDAGGWAELFCRKLYKLGYIDKADGLWYAKPERTVYNFCPCCGADMRPREDDKTGIRKEQGPDGPI